MESRDLGADPGDRELLRVATDAKRILVTIDKDFGAFLFLERVAHCGVVRLPDCRSDERIAVMSEVLALHSSDLSAGAVVTVRRGRMRISRSR